MQNRLRDLLVRLLCVPVADDHAVAVGASRPSAEVCDAILEWIDYSRPLFSHFVFEAEREGHAAFSLKFSSPLNGSAYLRVLGSQEIAADGSSCVDEALESARAAGADASVICFNYNPELDAPGVRAVETLLEQDPGLPGGPLLLEPRWVAALALERAKPLLPTNERAAASLGGSPHFEGRPEAEPERVVVSGNPLPRAFLVGEDSGLFRQKLEALQRRGPVEGTILLASVFFPPVTHSVRARKRFYEFFGAMPETIRLVEERAKWEYEDWKRHIAKYQRVDVLDLGQVEEYLAAPEYYQLPLNKAELREQVENIIALLDEPNYQLRFSTEAVDLPFELTPTTVRVRTDRRNKGQPRQGRLASITLQGRDVVDTFEREFWTLHRSAAPHLLDNGDIATWLRVAAKRYSGRPPRLLTGRQRYDVFLCYNSRDVADVRRIARRLERAGLRPWFDEWDARPGTPAIMALEAAISDIEAAAVFVGESGVGPWQQMELNAYLTKFANRNCPVIPVLLPSAPTGREPVLPPFLETMGWVDFRRSTRPTAFQRLVWGIDPSRQPRH